MVTERANCIPRHTDSLTTLRTEEPTPLREARYSVIRSRKRPSRLCCHVSQACSRVRIFSLGPGCS